MDTALVASGIINGAANFAKNLQALILQRLGWEPYYCLWAVGFLRIYRCPRWLEYGKRTSGGTPALGAIAGIFIFNPALANVELFGEMLQPGRGGLFAVLFAAWLMAATEKRVRKFI